MSFSYQKADEVEKSPSVGECVQDILRKETSAPEVGEIISEYGDSYTDQIKECILNNTRRYESPFYIVVMHKKEPWSINVMRNWFIARQSKPSMKNLWDMFPNHMHTVYEFDKKKEEIALLWTLPSYQEAKVIVKNWDLYDKQLVKWCNQAVSSFDLK